MPFYNPKAMKRGLAGASYSTSEGVWVDGKKIIFGVIDKPAGTGSRPHRHPNEQFIFVQQGTLKAMIEGKRKTVPAGGIIHIPANALHSMVAADGEDVVFIVAKDASWGIEGVPEDQGVLGAFIGKGAEKAVAAKYARIARSLGKGRGAGGKRKAPRGRSAARPSSPKSARES